ncbi:MAG: metal-dependent hydrolase [Candidatus Acidiferrales bacterium]
MDTITHGILGTLIGNGYFSERHGRVATFSAVLGAIFPDVDVAAEIFSHDPLSIVKYHRGITHSFVGLPFFAATLAGLTRWIARRRGIETPSWGMLTAIYGLAIASHIFLDGMTSFGTRMWTPISQQRVAWDLLFIIDFIFTAIILLPQIVAWIYRDREKCRERAARMWVILTLGVAGAWYLARAVGYAFHIWTAALASILIAALFFLPGLGDRGFRVKRSAWCQAGMYVMIAYLFFCATAHHAAIRRVADFAAANHLAVDRLGAIPLPPSLLDWGGVIRATDGVYASRFDLRDPDDPAFHFTSDSPPDSFTARALQLPEVKLYWTFARFPIIRTSVEDGHHIVDFLDQRFITRRRESSQPFTYRVVFDSGGHVIEEGWQSNGMNLRRIKKFPPPAGGSQ